MVEGKLGVNEYYRRFDRAACQLARAFLRLSLRLHHHAAHQPAAPRPYAWRPAADGPALWQRLVDVRRTLDGGPCPDDDVHRVACDRGRPAGRAGRDLIAGNVGERLANPNR